MPVLLWNGAFSAQRLSLCSQSLRNSSPQGMAQLEAAMWGRRMLLIPWEGAGVGMAALILSGLGLAQGTNGEKSLCRRSWGWGSWDSRRSRSRCRSRRSAGAGRGAGAAAAPLATQTRLARAGKLPQRAPMKPLSQRIPAQPGIGFYEQGWAESETLPRGPSWCWLVFLLDLQDANIYPARLGKLRATGTRARGGKAPVALPASPDPQAEPQTSLSWHRAVSRAHLGNKTTVFWEEQRVRVSKSQG